MYYKVSGKEIYIVEYIWIYVQTLRVFIYLYTGKTGVLMRRCN